MNAPDRFLIDPWEVTEAHLDLDALGQTESLFALANGHLGLRANLDEGEPNGIPGTYLGSVYERRPLPHAEVAYGYPESGQTIINVTNGKLIRLLVDDEPFDVRYGDVHSHRRTLDLRGGCLHRDVEWTSPAGQAVRLRSTRLVSFTQRSVAAIAYEVTSLDEAARIVVQSKLVANEPVTLDRFPGDPRTARALESPLVAQSHGAAGLSAVLVHRTSASGLGIAAAMDHQVTCEGRTDTTCVVNDDTATMTATTVLQAGQTLRIVKFLAYGWSSRRSRQALRDQAVAALTAATHTGWDGLLEEQRAYLDAFWDRADLEIDGDPPLQQAVRFAMFHTLQAGARAERRPIAAKGLTGDGYEGHAFWDTEQFVLPMLTYTVPKAAADELRWRHSTLPLARARADALKLDGASFPWRTINGEEGSGYWPAGTAGFHVNADIADAVVRYVDATEDHDFERHVGVELLIETARLWKSLGHFDRDGLFRIDGVTGPDEYSAVADNNVFTNLLAQHNLHSAAEAASRHVERAVELGVTDEETATWRAAAAAMFVPFDDRIGVHPQAEGFTDHQPWDFSATTDAQYPLMLHFPYFDLYRKQVVKQADLVLAMQLRPDAFDDEQKRRNFAYYERLTVRDSSLSAVTQAVMAAEVGHLDLAYDYLCEAAFIDLGDLHHNTQNGLHLASLAGSWTGLVHGFGGLRVADGELRFAPRLPEDLNGLVLRLVYRGRQVRLEFGHHEATYHLDEGEPLTISHHGEALLIEPGRPATRPIPAETVGPRPTQPEGREPLAHRSRRAG